MSYPGHSLGGGLSLLQRGSQCILQPQPTGQTDLMTEWMEEGIRHNKDLQWRLSFVYIKRKVIIFSKKEEGISLRWKNIKTFWISGNSSYWVYKVKQK